LDISDLYAAIREGAVERVRPKMMTVLAIMAGLLPIMWGTGSGSEVMRRDPPEKCVRSKKGGDPI
jgi:Cu(I)/Ag(I) efflux system membrane protein CusA/SilA